MDLHAIPERKMVALRDSAIEVGGAAGCASCPQNAYAETVLVRCAQQRGASAAPLERNVKDGNARAEKGLVRWPHVKQPLVGKDRLTSVFAHPFAMADMCVVQSVVRLRWTMGTILSFSLHFVLATHQWIAPIGSLRCSSVNDIPTHVILGSYSVQGPLQKERRFDISATAA